MECLGQASLARGGDTVTGETIEFDLASERLVVSGGTRLTLAPRGFFWFQLTKPEGAE